MIWKKLKGKKDSLKGRKEELERLLGDRLVQKGSNVVYKLNSNELEHLRKIQPFLNFLLDSLQVSIVDIMVTRDISFDALLVLKAKRNILYTLQEQLGSLCEGSEEQQSISIQTYWLKYLKPTLREN